MHHLMPLVRAPDNVRDLRKWTATNIDNAKVNYGTRNAAGFHVKRKRRKKRRKRKSKKNRKWRIQHGF